jgi:hypothetical protein
MELLTVAASYFDLNAPTVCSPLRPQSWCACVGSFNMSKDTSKKKPQHDIKEKRRIKKEKRQQQS